jgi:uncharacterized membrane protein
MSSLTVWKFPAAYGVKEEFPASHAELISTNLSNEQEAKLREAFAEEAWGRA